MEKEISNSIAHQHNSKPELVFGLVGPIGVDMDQLQSALVSALNNVGYQSETIHLTKLLERYETPPQGPFSSSYRAKIERANAFCTTAGNNAALAGLGILEIMDLRGARLSAAPDDIAKGLSGRAYIIRQLKRPDESSLLKKVYGDKFIQVSCSLDEDKRLQTLIRKISQENPGYTQNKCEQEARELIIIDDNQGDNARGQHVDEIFHRGDFFVDSGGAADRLNREVVHFIQAFFGDNSKSPRRDEVGAFTAASAALRSIDLSRQVGSAIFTPSGDIISIGCNEVPKAFGGNYWYEDEEKLRDFELGAEQNAIEKQRIIVDFLDRLKLSGLVVEDYTSEDGRARLSTAIDSALVSEITEYGRMTHAEMTAICDAARLGRSLQGSTIYVTTFPCHNCAKHIVASGISRVVYIEPYAKSKAVTSHPDSITTSGKHGRVSFEHFVGISPKRYQSIFKKEGKRREKLSLNNWFEGAPLPLVFDRTNSHLHREREAANLVLRGVKKRTPAP